MLCAAKFGIIANRCLKPSSMGGSCPPETGRPPCVASPSARMSSTRSATTATTTPTSRPAEEGGSLAQGLKSKGLTHADIALDRKVLLIVTGEFGRTPHISYAEGTQTGVKQPGRDHWPQAMSVLVAGGGLKMGQVVGST